MKRHLTHSQVVKIVGSLLTIAALAMTACQSAVHNKLQATSPRKSAPTFVLTDSIGKSASLDDYRGKVVLLDFWATWCHGCKQEIPWFAEFQRKYEAKGLNVVGVSMDDDWNTVKRFLAGADVPYRIVLGNENLSMQYDNYGLPDTFLIDREGKIAATYRGMVNKEQVEKDIQAAL